VIMAVPIIIAGEDHSGTFLTSGETLVVNRHGARIRIGQRLTHHMQVEITVPPRNLSRKGRALSTKPMTGNTLSN